MNKHTIPGLNIRIPAPVTQEMTIRLIAAAQIGLSKSPQHLRQAQLLQFAQEQREIAYRLATDGRTLMHLSLSGTLESMAEQAGSWQAPDLSFDEGTRALEEAIEALLGVSIVGAFRHLGRLKTIDQIVVTAQTAAWLAVVTYHPAYGVSPQHWVDAAVTAVANDMADIENGGRTGSSATEQRHRGLVNAIIRSFQQGDTVLTLPGGGVKVYRQDEVLEKGRDVTAKEARRSRWENMSADQRNDARRRNMERAIAHAEGSGLDEFGQQIALIGRLAIDRLEHMDEQEDGKYSAKDYEALEGDSVLEGERRVKPAVLVEAFMTRMEILGTPVSLEYAQAIVEFATEGSFSESLFDEEGRMKREVEESGTAYVNRRDPNILHALLWGKEADGLFLHYAALAKQHGMLVEYLQDTFWRLGVTPGKRGMRMPSDAEVLAVEHALMVYMNPQDPHNPWNLQKGSAWEERDQRSLRHVAPLDRPLRDEDFNVHRPQARAYHRELASKLPTLSDEQETVNGVPLELIGMGTLTPIDPTAKNNQRPGMMRLKDPPKATRPAQPVARAQ